jgi:hypothetical protein
MDLLVLLPLPPRPSPVLCRRRYLKTTEEEEEEEKKEMEWGSGHVLGTKVIDCGWGRWAAMQSNVRSITPIYFPHGPPPAAAPPPPPPPPAPLTGASSSGRSGVHFSPVSMTSTLAPGGGRGGLTSTLMSIAAFAMASATELSSLATCLKTSAEKTPAGRDEDEEDDEEEDEEEAWADPPAPFLAEGATGMSLLTMSLSTSRCGSLHRYAPRT